MSVLFEVRASPIRTAIERYVEAAERQPPTAPCEYAWQWRYRGRPSERDLLAELLECEHTFVQERLFDDDLRFMDHGSPIDV